jgi:excisionase family DNA binding protein
MSKKQDMKQIVLQQGKPEGYLTVREAMAAYGCSEPTVRRWLQQRLVKAVRYRRRVFIRLEDVRRLDAIRPYVVTPSSRSYASVLEAGTPEPQSAGQGEAQP